MVSGPGGTLLDRCCHSLAHGPCLETTGRHRRTNRRPGVGGPERDLDVENVDADPGGKPHFRGLAQLRAWVEHLKNGPYGNEFGTDPARRSEPDDLEAANASVAGI